MTDVEMKDPAPAKDKAPSKAAEGSGEGKKRFEVKKVHLPSISRIIKLISCHHSGMPLLYGRGISSSITVLSAATISWIYVRTILSVVASQLTI